MSLLLTRLVARAESVRRPPQTNYLDHDFRLQKPTGRHTKGMAAYRFSPWCIPSVGER